MPQDFRSVFITGTRRAGKSLLGDILGTYQNVEYAEEPYPIMSFPSAIHFGSIEPQFGTTYLRSMIAQSLIECVLLRSANFRANDLSSIWRKKTPNEIFERMATLEGAADAWSYIKKNKVTFILTLPENMAFPQNLLQASPEASFIHVVRNGFDVANDVMRKQWFTLENLKTPRFSNLYYRYTNRESWFLPWWVTPGDEDRFLSYSEYERSLYYWVAQHRSSRLDELNNDRLFVVDYDRFVADPGFQIRRIQDSLQLTPGQLTNQELRKVELRLEKPRVSQIDKNLRDSVIEINTKLGIKNVN